MRFSNSHDFLPGPEIAIRHQFFSTSGTIVLHKTKFIQLHGIGDAPILTPGVDMIEIIGIQG